MWQHSQREMTASSHIPEHIQPAQRRTKYMIEQENNRILEYYRAGASHIQIRNYIGLSECQYWRRIKQIQIQDMEQLQAKQTQESRAFLHQRMVEKLQAYEQGALAIATNKAYKPTDRIAAFQLLRQLAADEYSLEKYGPSSFIIPSLNDKLLRGNRETAALLSEAVQPGAERQQPLRIPTTDTDSNRVF